MDYIMKNCPQCNRELPVPAELKECICMYCGEHFHIEEEPAPELGAVELQEINDAYQAALEQVSELVNHYDKLLQKFTRDAYPASFDEYVKLGEEILSPIDRYTELSQEARFTVAAQISEKLMLTIENTIRMNKGIIHKNSKSVLIDQHRFFLAVYLIPMLGYLKLALCETLADCIMEDWKRNYPKCEFEKATYDELSAGFLRKGFCYITSAICDTLSKPDDCYELMRFREFRDNYMMKSDTTRRLVEEYYRSAPRIVAYINMQPEREEKYSVLWDKYLQPCLKDIEQGHNQRCRNRYVRMVRELNRSLPLPNIQ